MAGVYNNFFQGLEWRVAYKGAADHAFEPGPFAFCTHSRVDTNKAASGLDEAHQGKLLGIGVKDVVVSIGKDQRIILLQVLVGEIGRGVGDIYLEAMLMGELPDTSHGGGDVLMNIALTVFGVNQDTDILPIKSRRNGGSRNEE